MCSLVANSFSALQRNIINLLAVTQIYHTKMSYSNYGRHGGRGKERSWQRDSQGHSSDASWEENGKEQKPSGRGRHPPGLKGKEIGLWYARRNKSNREQEQKLNRPTVAIDHDREMKIRHLLRDLQADEASGSLPAARMPRSRSDTSTGTHLGPRLKEEPLDSWNNLPGPSQDSKACSYRGAQLEPRVKQGPPDSSERQDSWKMLDEQNQHLKGRSHTDTNLKRRIKEETVDSWRLLDGQDQVSDDQCHMAQMDSRLQDEAVVDLDDYDEDGRPLPSVAGVVQYMKSHGDYPYMGDEGAADYESHFLEEDNPRLDQEMTEHMQQLNTNPQFLRMLDFRKKLPSYAYKDIIVSAVANNQVLVICGETGCGKTTQVPQFILDDFIARGQGSQCRLICTQPRRISAISVAERVAAERCEKVGTAGSSSVGYQIRLETRQPRSQGSILFCTTGIVLKFLEGDPSLRRATHIILDEIHERDLQSDFLMIILKDLIQQRSDLKVILMSATLNAEMFSQYFNNCAMMNIPGFTFPVKEYFLEDVLELTRYVQVDEPRFQRRAKRQTAEERTELDNYQTWCRSLSKSYSPKTVEVLRNFDYSKINLDLIQHIINFISSHMGEGAILVFVPGWEEIRKLHEMLQATARNKFGSIKVIPLHSLMPTVNQREVFDRPPPGVRKIVIATNIAETSITIDDVVYVVDSGKIKIKNFQPEMNLTCLEAQWVAKANAKQRKGRAGRVQAGHCFHLFTKFQHDLIPDYLPPEMLRTRLEELCLQIKLLRLGQIVPFISKAMQHPSMEAVTHAICTLKELNALDADENLLPLGYHLARMPVEPHTGKMILFGAMFCCLDPILTVAASLSFKDAFVIPLGKEELADRVRFKLAKDSKSDHIMLINTFKGWEKSLQQGRGQNYCWENFLSENTLRMLRDMKKQLAELLCDLGFVGSKSPKDTEANRNSDNLALVRAVLCAGLYPNIAQIIKVPKSNSRNFQGVVMVIKDKSRVMAHPKSVNVRQTFFESKWVVFYYKLKTSQVYIHDSTMVSPYALLFFGGDIKIVVENQTELVTVDDWVTFKASTSTAQLVKDLRQQLDKLLTSKITRPGPTKWDRAQSEGALLAAIADLITQEDLNYSIRDSDLEGSIGRKC
ncbi:hypothetical protein BsWGS_26418 [Bradybaena similaris]